LKKISACLRAGVWLLPGAASVFGFAPFYYYPVAVLMLAVLFAGWQRATPGQAARRGYFFGLGLFLAGVSWVYVSLHDFGGMPLPLALLATFLFCAFLALFPAAAGYLTCRISPAPARRLLLLAPAAWALAEWLRGLIFTGFPWLSFGYSQVPGSPLVSFAPLLGVYGVSWLAALCAGSLVLLRARPRLAAPLLVVLLAAGVALHPVAWTHPEGAPVQVRLIQGNIPQEMKWDPQQAAKTLQIYLQMVQDSHEPLVILPETALPLFNDQLPPAYLNALAQPVRARHGDLLYGVPERDGPGMQAHYYNSVVSIGTAPSQHYRKQHLVPFGEYVPPAFGWVLKILHIPLSDFSRGGVTQQPLAVAGQRVAVNICYEDAFGEEIIRQLPQATLLVNVSNDAWFGHSFAAWQQLQMSQMRALETGRYALRATNTGMTAIIDPKGRLVRLLPADVRGALTGTAQGYAGATPYVRWGNGAILVLALLALSGGWWRRRK
jgi:apolipoprotein N-acyltransferase